VRLKVLETNLMNVLKKIKEKRLEKKITLKTYKNVT